MFKKHGRKAATSEGTTRTFLGTLSV